MTLQGNQNNGPTPRNRTYKLTGAKKREVYLADRLGRWSRAEIAKAYGISPSRVTQICKEFDDL